MDNVPQIILRLPIAREFPEPAPQILQVVNSAYVRYIP